MYISLLFAQTTASYVQLQTAYMVGTEPSSDGPVGYVVRSHPCGEASQRLVGYLGAPDIPPLMPDTKSC